ncbi:hypothetical protein WNY78_05140 [Psychroserpens sp. AS72]|uniref:hypothetical protein n=1 Tax=Psychroserpens sp. AS72 TaxID=3135775 RepID=UPI00317401D0
MKIIVYTFFLLGWIFCSAQNDKPQVIYKYQKDTLFLNETNQPIIKKSFNLKLDSPLFSSLRFENDTLVLYKLRFSHLFGKLKISQKHQLFSLLNSRNNVDTTKVMIIHYQDSLKPINEFAKKTGIAYNKDSTTHRHVMSHKTFVVKHKDCVRKLSKRNKSNVYHYFKVNNGHPLEFKKAKWYEDYYGLIDKLFRDSYSRFFTIVIHPDGSFYCKNYNDNNGKIFKDLIKGKRWKLHKKEFEENLNSLNSKV